MIEQVQDVEKLEIDISDIELTFFYGGTFSQWKPCVFVEDGIEFNCAEQYMMYHKAMLFNDVEIVNRIILVSDPREHKRLGRLVRNFNEKIWDDNKYEIVKRGNLLKFSQNSSLREELLSTGDSILVEASPSDRVWGIGMGASNPKRFHPSNWRGQNLLGYALSEVKEILKENL